MKNVALIGGGRMGSIHLRNILRHPGINCKYVSSSSESRARNFLSKQLLSPLIESTITPLSSDITPIVEDDTIDGVIIASPSPYHYKQTLKCLENKKPVFCEKPICETLDEIDNLYDVCNKNNLPPIMVGHQRRFDPNFLSLYNKIHNEKLLEINDIQHKNTSLTFNESLSLTSGIEKIISISRDPIYPEIEYLDSNMNCFYDSVSHDIDTICWLANNNFPNKVYVSAKANCKNIEKLNDYDRLFVTLEFSNGMLGMIDWCRHSGFSYDQRLNVLGYNGMSTIENEKEDTIKYYNNSNGEENALAKYYFWERYEMAYENEINTFVDILNGKYNDNFNECKPLTTYESMKNLQIIIRACIESANSGQAVSIDYQQYYKGKKQTVFSTE